MAKASIQLPNGTVVGIEGTPEEIKKLLEFYGGVPIGKKKSAKDSGDGKGTSDSTTKKHEAAQVDLTEIINLVKNCDESEKIETEILDKTSQVNRILLPLYIVHEHLDNSFGLTSVEISNITKELGIPMQQPNVSRTLSGTASKYVISDGLRRRGKSVRYKLTRRGLTYIKDTLRRNKDGQ